MSRKLAAKGPNFHARQFARTKKAALAHRDAWKKRGHQARVVKAKGGYKVFSRSYSGRTR